MFKTVKNNRNRIISSFLVVCLVAVGMFSYIGNAAPVEAKSVSDYEKELAKLEKQQKEINAKLSGAQKKINSEKEKQVLLDSQIKSVEEQIVIYQGKINVVTANVATKEEEIAAKLVEIDKNEELFAKRVRTMYISNLTNSSLSTLLSAKSFSDFLNSSEILKRISQSDKDLIETLSQQKTDLDAAKAALQAEQADLKKTKADFDAKNKSLDAMYDQSKASEAETLKIQKEYALKKQATEKEIKAQEKALNDLIASLKNDGAGPQGQLAWPIPSSSRVTSPFGWRTMWGKQEWHTGIDIGANKGTPIVAADGGTVILSKKSNYGYGWHVAINHGGGYTTLYAHTSDIYVNVGDTVTRGQKIAAVGSTGASTGNHLHFEVRINGKQMDPMGYVKKPS